MTLPLINATRAIAFVVSGAEKASIVRRVLREREASARLPAQLVQPADGELTWMLDRAAAGELS
jgi:6-phosphogluconolactonase